MMFHLIVAPIFFTIQKNDKDNDTKEYYDSIANQNFTRFDGVGVKGFEAKRLSASQINKFNSCPLAYLYSNKSRISSPSQKNEEGFDNMEKGSLMHLCYELFGKKIRDENLTTNNEDELYNIMYDVSIDAYNHADTKEARANGENIYHQIFLSDLQADLKDTRDKGLLAKFVDYYIEKIEEFEYFKNSEFEKPFALDKDLKPYIIKNKDDRNYFIRGFYRPF